MKINKKVTLLLSFIIMIGSLIVYFQIPEKTNTIRAITAAVFVFGLILVDYPWEKRKKKK